MKPNQPIKRRFKKPPLVSQYGKDNKQAGARNTERPENIDVSPIPVTGNENDTKPPQGKGKRVLNLPPPSEHTQQPLITLLREHLDVVNVYKLGKAMGRINQVRHFIERQRPFIDGQDWLLFNATLKEEVRLMEEFVKSYKKMKL
jgi:hypothetical protein